MVEDWVPGVMVRRESPGPVPVLFDSPHSGRDYPADFGAALPVERLRRIEDAYVDELFADAPATGAGLLAALFPRAYVDANRHRDEIDPLLLAEPWPVDLPLTERADCGLGVVRRLFSATEGIYDRRLSVAEVEARLARCHDPYHRALDQMLEALQRRFGAVWHVNCHSMKAMGRGRGGKPAPIREDFVLGDLDGQSCDGDFTDFVAGWLKARGHSVAINSPFKGAAIVTRHGRPTAGRHSLQIEINRGLYLDEMAVAKTAGFAPLRRTLGDLAAAIAAYASDRAPERRLGHYA